MATVPVSPHGIPLLGFGTWPLSGAEAERCVAMALETGFRHIDTAQMYGNERQVGRAIAASGLKRGEVFVATKIGPENASPSRLAAAVARSLDALDFAAVDLLLIHWPPADELFDGAIAQLAAARESGTAARIGVSNQTVALARRAQQIAGGTLVNNQVEFHPLLDQSKVKAEADALGMTLSAYSPLARGAVLKERILIDIGNRLGRQPSEIALRWIVQQGIAAIPMTTKPANARSNLSILDFTLNPADMAAISKLTARNRRLISPPGWAPDWD